MSNVKAGDLAIVVKSLVTKNVGLIVRVISRGENIPSSSGNKYLDENIDVCWLIAHKGSRLYEGAVCGLLYGPFSQRVMADECLRPIRDPGDDAVDESLAYLPPVPTKETA